MKPLPVVVSVFVSVSLTDVTATGLRCARGLRLAWVRHTILGVNPVGATLSTIFDPEMESAGGTQYTSVHVSSPLF